MPVPYWPPAMRQTPQRGSWTGGPQDARAKFEPEYGPPLMRRRTTAETEIWQGMFPNLTATMRTAFRTFWATDLSGGALAFAWRDPVTDEVAMWRILGSGDRAYDMAHKGAGLSDLTVQLMRLPGTPWWAPYVLAGMSLPPLLVLGFQAQAYGQPPTRQAFGDLVSLTRASTATFVGANGLVQSAAVNVPRIDANGLLLEAAATNLLLRSQEFDNATWGKVEATVTANAGSAPDGTTTAEKIIPSVNNLAHRATQSGIAVTSGLSYRLSCFVKASGYGWVRLSLGTSFPANYMLFDLATGALGLNSGFTGITAESLGNGWWRLSGSLVATGSGTTEASVYPLASNTLTTFAGDGTSGILAWGAQVEQGALSSYIPTTTAAATRSADVVSLVNAITAKDVRIINRSGVVTDLLNTTIAGGTWPAAAVGGARSIVAYPAGTL
jgi:hypothetical protein